MVNVEVQPPELSMGEVLSHVKRSWVTNRPNLVEVQQFLAMAVKAGAGDDAEATIEVNAGEGQYGKSDCHMTVRWRRPVE